MTAVTSVHAALLARASGPMLLRAVGQGASPAAGQAPSSGGGPFGQLRQLLATEGVEPLLRVALILLVGFPLLFALSRWIRSWVARTGTQETQQRGMVVGKFVLYAGWAVLAVWVLDELGFGIAPLLGAAGILGIALGFASQTSVSNIISGFFLMVEQPFRVDDIIQVGSTLGRVESIDMLSVKLRTFDNKFVRIPNESIIKTEVTNITRYPIRRVDMAVGVAYKEDVEHVRQVLREVADANPIALMEPEPLVMFDGYGESALNFSFRVWATRENWLELKNTLHQDVKEAFDEEGIEIPFPHRTLYTGLVTDPFPVRMVDGGEAGEDAGPRGGERRRGPDGGGEDEEERAPGEAEPGPDPPRS